MQTWIKIFLNPDKIENKFVHCKVQKQTGVLDCGLFALAFLTTIVHKQEKLRNHYNKINLNNFQLVNNKK